MKSIMLIAGLCSLTLFASERKLQISNQCRDVLFTAYYKNELGYKDHGKISPGSTYAHTTTSDEIVLSWYNAQFQQKIPTDDRTKIVIEQAIAIKLGAQQPIYRILHPGFEPKNFYQPLKKSSSSYSLASSSESSSED